MTGDLVVGLDSSTTATKAIAWTRDGRLVAEARAPVPLARPAPDRYEQDPEDWWRAAVAALRSLTAAVDPARIAALGIANQRETFVALDAAGAPVRPAIIWLDERCRPAVDGFAARVGEDRLHRLTGKPKDTAPVAYRLAWMAGAEPEAYAGVARFVDVHAYLTWRLTGRFGTSWASADPFGLVDMAARRWAAPVLEALALTPDRLADPAGPGQVLGAVTADAAAATGLRGGTLVAAGGGDGQLAGLGVNALAPGTAYLNLGTAVVAGIQTRRYATGMAWRTMISGAAAGYTLETSLRSGTFLLDWAVREVFGAGAQPDPAIYRRLESDAAEIAPGADGLLVLPYWNGVMTPYWEAGARGAMIGFTSGHRRGHVWRAVLEGIALEQAMVTHLVEDGTGERVERLIAVGGGAASDLWCQIVADTAGVPVHRSATVEASCLGAAMCAAVGAGWHETSDAAAAAMAGPAAARFAPDPDAMARYRQIMPVYRDLYPALRPTFARLPPAPGQ